MFALADCGKSSADPRTVLPGAGADTAGPGHVADRLSGFFIPFAGRRAPRMGLRSVRAWAAALAAGLALTLAAIPAQAQTSGKLVSNTGQTHGGTHVGSDADRAQAFTTGSIAGGYKLTAVKVDTVAGALASGATFGLYATDGSGHPTGSSLGTFTNPAGQWHFLSAHERIGFFLTR